MILLQEVGLRRGRVGEVGREDVRRWALGRVPEVGYGSRDLLEVAVGLILSGLGYGVQDRAVVGFVVQHDHVPRPAQRRHVGEHVGAQALGQRVQVMGLLHCHDDDGAAATKPVPHRGRVHPVGVLEIQRIFREGRSGVRDEDAPRLLGRVVGPGVELGRESLVGLPPQRHPGAGQDHDNVDPSVDGHRGDAQHGGGLTGLDRTHDQAGADPSGWPQVGPGRIEDSSLRDVAAVSLQGQQRRVAHAREGTDLADPPRVITRGVRRVEVHVLARERRGRVHVTARLDPGALERLVARGAEPVADGLRGRARVEIEEQQHLFGDARDVVPLGARLGLLRALPRR